MDRPEPAARQGPHGPLGDGRGDVRHAGLPGDHHAAWTFRSKEIRLSGGGARSEFWRQLQADVYGQQVVTINAEEGPAYGVALLAAAGTGAYKDVVEACAATISVTTQTKTQPKARRTYDAAHAVYQQLYRSLKADFRTINDQLGR